MTQIFVTNWRGVITTDHTEIRKKYEPLFQKIDFKGEKIQGRYKFSKITQVKAPKMFLLIQNNIYVNEKPFTKRVFCPRGKK